MGGGYKLGDICEIIRGVTYTKKEQHQTKTDKVVLTADNISLDNHLRISKEIYLKDEIMLSDEKLLKAEDIFMTFSSGSMKHIGKLAYIKENLNKYAGGFMGILRAKKDLILPKYLYLFLCSDDIQNELKINAKGSNINNLNSSIKNIQIPVPPLEIQEKVIKKCDEIEKEYEKSLKTLENYTFKIKEIFDAYLN